MQVSLWSIAKTDGHDKERLHWPNSNPGVNHQGSQCIPILSFGEAQYTTLSVKRHKIALVPADKWLAQALVQAGAQIKCLQS